MSSKDIENLQKEAKQQSELLEKKRAIDSFRTQADYDRMIQSQREVDGFRSINIEANREDQIKKIIQENDEYMEAAKLCKTFVCDSFKGIVPNFGKNINLIGASTGDGKSTTVANIALETTRQGGKTLILTNEEAIPDVYNRITCLLKGWVYANHNEFTDEQKAVLKDGINKLSQYITVIGDSTFGPGTTTTLEGVEGVLESLISNSQKYDSIIIDYVQKVSFSKLNPRLAGWEVLSKLMQYLDGYKNRYLAPINLMAQLHNSGENNKQRSFEDRLKGFKGIITPVTCAMEMVADKRGLKTKFVIHKNRWYAGSMDGQEIVVGWYKGKYVELSNQGYQSWVKMKQGERIAKTLEANNASRKHDSE